jgi:hypothetical protein
MPNKSSFVPGTKVQMINNQINGQVGVVVANPYSVGPWSQSVPGLPIIPASDLVPVVYPSCSRIVFQSYQGLVIVG